jgi:inhibitor of KinA sporulation pathway (predicted exonuclease)
VLLNVVDLEATCWEGSAPAGQRSEVIEIGLTVVDLVARERVAKHRILVKPSLSAVSEFCTALTGLTQDEVDGGVPFSAACAELVGVHESLERPWASWGDYDRKQFVAQCAAEGVGYPFGSVHVNAKAVFAEARGLRRQAGMAKALRLAGLPLEGRHHSGADDAWNIAALVLLLVEDGSWPV